MVYRAGVVGGRVAVPVVLDSNALLLPFEKNISIEQELTRLLGSYEAIVPEAVLKELATMAALGKGRRKRDAQSALTLAARYRFVNTEAKGDAGVLDVARGLDAVVFSNDKEVRRLAREAGLRTVYLRGMSHLEVEGE